MISLARTYKLGLILAAAFFLALFAASQAPRSAHALFVDSDGDSAIDVAEEISRSDPNDANSTPEGTSAEFISGLPICSDGVDNDLDGQTDLDDLGCHDSDNDIISDDLEQFLGSDPNDSASFPEDSRFDAAAEYYGFPLNVCGDLRDNDLDGNADTDDIGCTPISDDGDRFDDAAEKRFGSDPGDANSVPEHEAPNPGSCSDGTDNDRDGMTDAADPACTTPANDNRANATTITTVPYTEGPVLMKNATAEPGERGASCRYGDVSGTTWYRYTPTADTVVVADTIGSNFETAVSAWTESGSRLQEVACDYGYPSFPGTGNPARIAFRATGGVTYYIQVDANPGFFRDSPPSITFHLDAGAAPANDQFQDAALISSLPFTSSVDTEKATRQPGEPYPYCSYDISTGSVWYKFSPSSDTLLVVNTEGSDFQAVLQAYTETKFGLGPIACSTGGDPFGGIPPADTPAAQIVIHATAGQNYYIQVSGVSFGASFGNLSLRAAVGVAPPHDDFANARLLGALPFEESTDILTAGVQDDEPTPSCTYYPPDATVWYRYTASASGGVIFETEGTNFYNQFIAVYEGSSLADLTQIACGYPYYSPYAEVGIEVIAGQTYYIQAGRIGSFDGPIFFAEGGGEGSGFSGSFGGTTLVLIAEELDIPDCPAGGYTYNDPTGDTFDLGILPGAHDITSLRVGSTAEALCITVDFMNEVDPGDADTSGALWLFASLDTDANSSTGWPGEIDFACGRRTGLGPELTLSTSSAAGILVPFFPFFFEPPLPGGQVPEEEELYIYILVSGRTAQLIVPLEVAGGDDAFGVGVYAASPGSGPSDCAPNSGHLACAAGTCQVIEIRAGDANCDGQVNAIDATIVLQSNAGLLFGMPCANLGDANSNGFIGPVDATLILQYGSGLIDEMPVWI